MRTLVTIVDTGGFRRASEVLNISQPAVSQHIRKLDTLIGEPVFRETGQSLRLSVAGEELLRFARRLVDTNDELVLRLSAAKRGGRLTLGVCDTLVGVIPDLITALREHVPLPWMSVQTGPGDRLSDQHAAGAVDMVLRLGDPVGPADEVIGAVDCSWFGQPGLLSGAGPVPLAVFAAREAPLRRLAEDTLTARQVGWHVVYEGVGVEDVVTVTRSGFGVSLLFAAAEPRWDLPVLPPGLLPEPVRSLPVVLSAGSRLTGDLTAAVLPAVRSALSGYTTPANA
ncbi:LysR family transcriptional regulator [Streptomyces sp. NPDC051133]|uniref:LysR family transcriptional regulator n=1 Tax=Streptomyces sp. NPDC051133 TaxID=3155521 RepID=UPI0034121075